LEVSVNPVSEANVSNNQKATSIHSVDGAFWLWLTN